MEKFCLLGDFFLIATLEKDKEYAADKLILN